MTFVRSMVSNRILWDDPDIQEEEIQAAVKSLKNSVGSKGPNIKIVEDEFAKKLNVKHAILTSNGTTALVTSLSCLIEHNSKIKTIGVPSFTFIASANSAKLFNKKIQLLDCDKNTWNVEAKHITSDVDLLVSVDVGGLPCDYDDLKKLDIPVVADSAESLGSTYKNEEIGSQVDIHCFSFQRSKIITCGEGGLIVTNNDEYADYCRSFINHGYSKNKQPYEYLHDQFGLNFRINDVEAAILGVQLKKLRKYVERRNEVANLYKNGLDKEKFEFQKIPEFARTNYFFFGALLDKNNRQDLAQQFLKNDIDIKYWTAVGDQPGFINKNLPNSKYISDSIILLPIHNKITNQEVEKVITIANK